MSRALVHVSVTDEDDETPTFDPKLYWFSTMENLPENTNMGQVRAVDKDVGSNSAFSYYIDSHKDVFRIDAKTGMIFTKLQLDRESTAEYLLYVFVKSDTSLKSVDTATVAIRILDQNDNAPIILYPNEHNSTLLISTLTEPLQTVAQVRAVDIDEGPNSELLYELVGESASDLFTLDGRTGEISTSLTAASLSTAGNETTTLVIRVTDSAGPLKHTTHATLRIIVTDDVITHPIFLPSPHTLVFVEWLSQNMLIFIAAGLAVFLTVLAVLVIAVCFLIRRRRRSKSLARLLSLTRVELKELTESARMESLLVGEESRLLPRMSEVLLLNLDAEPIQYGVG